MLTISKSDKEAIRDTFNVPENISRLANMAEWDLWHGPMELEEDGDVYPGWVTAADILQEWAEKNLHAVWVGEESGCVCTSEPAAGYYDDSEVDEEGDPVWVEEWETYTEYSLKEVAGVLLGKEVAAHIWL